ncbi:MAG: AI-2E family transporter [Nanobdellota archaeon]
MSDAERFRKVFATVIVIILLLFVAYAFMPYLNGLFGAVILYALLRPLYKYLHLYMRPGFAASSIIVLTFIIILITLVFIISMLVGEINAIIQGSRFIIENIGNLEGLVPNVNFEDILLDQINKVGSFVQNALISTLRGVGQMVITFFIMYVILFYLFVNTNTLKKNVCAIIPFNPRNSQHLIDEFSRVTYSTVISTGLIALLQGTLVTVGFLIFGIQGAFLWGVVGIILSFLPVLGIPLIWIPAGVIQLVMEDYTAGIGILVWGFIISNIDNFLRPALQRRFGAIHPLISIIGVFIGVPLFGILGLIIGPLLLSYLVLTLRMFNEEFMKVET